MAIVEASRASVATVSEEAKAAPADPTEESAASAYVIIRTGVQPIGPDDIGVGEPGSGTPITEEVHAVITATEEARVG